MEKLIDFNNITNVKTLEKLALIYKKHLDECKDTKNHIILDGILSEIWERIHVILAKKNKLL